MSSWIFVNVYESSNRIRRLLEVILFELQISNIWSFKYFDDILGAPKIIFDKSLNIFIGENGSGKSTALEVINFVFKRVLFTQFNVNQDLYHRKSTLTASDKKQILAPVNSNSYSGFRLEPNWDTENNSQKNHSEDPESLLDVRGVHVLPIKTN